MIFGCMDESTGKEFSKGEKRVFEGITPTVSYLGGPYDKFTTFINVKQNNSDMIVPDISEYSKLIEVIQGRRLKELMDAIMRGVKTAFKKSKRPFTELILQDKSEYTIGQLLQFKMMEMMHLGFLLRINPFDQPNVEDYKVKTRKILESKKIVSRL